MKQEKGQDNRLNKGIFIAGFIGSFDYMLDDLKFVIEGKFSGETKPIDGVTVIKNLQLRVSSSVFHCGVCVRFDLQTTVSLHRALVVCRVSRFFCRVCSAKPISVQPLAPG